MEGQLQMSYVEQILGFDKENLVDILHYLALEIEERTGFFDVRVYMEEMHEGALVCLYTREGELERKGARIPIHRRDSFLVKAFLESKYIGNAQLKTGADEVHLPWIRDHQFTRAAVFPMFYAEGTVGILVLDAPEGDKDVLTSSQRESIESLLAKVMPVLAKAHRFNQQIMLGRYLDRSRKRNTARILLDGAFKLDLALDMTSVLVTADYQVPEALRDERGGYMDILAGASRDPSDLPVYETLERISILEGKSLLSQLVMQSGDIVRKRQNKQDYVFFSDILSESVERQDVFNQLSLRTLLMVPVEDTFGKIICVVNYFTKRPHSYTDPEIKLLRSHAKAIGRAIEETDEEHFEIKVLSEIESLLAEETRLNTFLGKVVSLAVELLGADSGSIALVKERDQERWLIVEDNVRKGLVGAKSRGWRKANIPDLKVGGDELPHEERSLTGYVAHTGKPYLCGDVAAELSRSGFYRELASKVVSELAVPIMMGNSAIGVINLDSYSKDYFTVEHQRFLVLISRLIAGRITDQMKIIELTQKVDRLKKEVTYKDPEVSSYLLGNIIGKSDPSQALVERMSRLTVPLTNRLISWARGGDKEVELGLPTILITGETGAGKEFVFNNLYTLLNERFKDEGANRRELPIRKTNIAAFSGDLTYTELFGHRKGAYTGADSDRQGVLEEADGGVVFLDEIGDSDLKTQVQLLRFLDSGEFSRLGENRLRRSRVMFVAATNKNLIDEIEKDNFREDLYHRLREITLSVPSLRQRRDDIPDLARHFLGRLHASYSDGGDPPRLTEGARALLSTLDYPGNIRQLVTILQGALFERTSDVIDEEDVLRSLANIQEPSLTSSGTPAGLYEKIRSGEGDFWTLVHGPFLAREITRDTVLTVFRMAQSEGSGVKAAARLLGALSDDPENDEKGMTRFRNFIYKTVGVAREL